MKRYYLLDAARGVAAFMVLFFHYQHFFIDPLSAVPNGSFAEPIAGYSKYQPFYNFIFPLYKFGWAAVPLFWMISGFVFSRVYIEVPTTLRQFAINRFGRLYPLHFATLRIPHHHGQRFHEIMGTVSTGTWAVIPRDHGQGFHAMLGT